MPVEIGEEVDRALETLRVITFNLLAPDQADWDRRREVIRSGLRELRPDVVALQETVWGNGYDQASDLLGPDYEIARHASRSADGVGAVANCHRIFDQAVNGVWASDHFGVLADLRVPHPPDQST
jgi:endonuclease/exonuclease/phosphatase family metal-dependent hydrolase